jgi:hypothetical protein
VAPKSKAQKAAGEIDWESDIDDEDLENEVTKVWPPARGKKAPPPPASVAKGKGKGPVVLDIDDDDDDAPTANDPQMVCYKDLLKLRSEVHCLAGKARQL